MPNNFNQTPSFTINPNWTLGNGTPSWFPTFNFPSLGTPTNTSGGGGGGTTNTSAGTITNSGSVTTLDKLLAALTTNLALIRGANQIPTTGQNVDVNALLAQQQAALLGNRQPLGDGSTGATLGASIESFVTQNTGILLIGGVAFLLFKSGRK